MEHDGPTLPTPFTADEIRAATPEGHTVDLTIEEHGAVSRRRTIFTDCDADGARIHTVAIDEHGDEVGDTVAARTTWADLQAHASFPADATVRTDDTVTTALGTFECRRYEVRRGDDVMNFYFANDLPGMPVLFSVSREGTLMSVTEVTAMSGVD